MQASHGPGTTAWRHPGNTLLVWGGRCFTRPGTAGRPVDRSTPCCSSVEVSRSIDRSSELADLGVGGHDDRSLKGGLAPSAINSRSAGCRPHTCPNVTVSIRVPESSLIRCIHGRRPTVAARALGVKTT